MWVEMKKRLFCVLLAVSMIGSSVMVHAAETDGAPASASPVWEGQDDMTGEIQEPEENEGEGTENADVTPDIIPGEDEISQTEPTQAPEEEPEKTPETESEDAPVEEPEVTPTSEPTEMPEEEPEVTPEAEPTETPTEEPEEIPEVTPAGVPTQEPEITPGAEPTEIPEGSPSPDMLVTPGIMEEFEEGIEPIMDDGTMRAAATPSSTPVPKWKGYLTAVRKYISSNGTLYGIYIDEATVGKGTGINSTGILTLTRYRLTSRAAFTCSGTINVVKTENYDASSYVATSYIKTDQTSNAFTLGSKGTINIQEGLILRIENNNNSSRKATSFKGTINLEPNAKLIIDGVADFSGATINMGEGATLQVNGGLAQFMSNTIINATGPGANIIANKGGTIESVILKGSGPVLTVKGDASFTGGLTLSGDSVVRVTGDATTHATTTVSALGNGTIRIEGSCAPYRAVTVTGDDSVLTLDGDVSFNSPINLTEGGTLHVTGKAGFGRSATINASGKAAIRVEGDCADFKVVTVTGENSVLTIDGDAGFADKINLSDNSTVRVTGDAGFGYYPSVTGQGTVSVGNYTCDTNSTFQLAEKITLNIEKGLTVAGRGSLSFEGMGSLKFDDGCEALINSNTSLNVGTNIEVSDSGTLVMKGTGELICKDGCKVSAGTVRIDSSLPFSYETLIIGNSGRLEIETSGDARTFSQDNGNLNIEGGTVFINGSFLQNPNEQDMPGNILISDSGSLEVGTTATPGDLIQKQGMLQINSGTVSVTGNYSLSGNAAVDINKGSAVSAGGKVELIEGSITVGADSGLVIGTAAAPGNLSHGKGTLKIDGGTVHVTGNHDLSTGSVLELGAGSVLEVDGNFVKNSGTGASYTEGTIKVGKDVDLRDSFNGTENFRLIMNGNDGQKIISKNSRNKLNVQLEGRNVTTVGAFEPTLYSGGAITPDGGTLVVTGLKVNGCELKVNGDVEASGKVDVGGKTGRLEVMGDYVQPSDYLKLNGGEVIIGGDYRIQKKSNDGKYSVGLGGLIMDNPNPKEPSTSRLTVNGSLYMESSNASRYSYWGTMTVKGNIEQKKAGGFDKFDGYRDFRLILAGDGPQTVSIESRDSVLNQLELKNQNVTVKGYLNAKLVADGTISLPAQGSLELTGLELQGNKLTIKGGTDSLVKASGNVDIGGSGGHLVVPGDFMQSSGILRIGEGTMDVGNDLLILDKDDNKNYKTGEGSLIMTGSKGMLNVKGDLVVQSRRNTTLSSGTLVLSGNLVQRKGEDGRGTGYVNATSTNHKLILAGDGPQNIIFDNEKGMVGTLQLTKDKSEYGFDPDEVSMKVTTGSDPTPDPPAPSPKPPVPSPKPPAPSPGPQPSDWPFSDVPVNPGNWRYDSIKYVYDNGIMNGIKGTTRFDPEEPLTRGMFATVLYRMAGEPPVNAENRFTDVRNDKYYSNAIIWAYSKGIVQGIGGGVLFGPEESITREQIAKMLYEFGKSQGYTMDGSADLSGFPDNSDVSNWALDYMRWAVGSGMINGKNIGGAYYLDPKGNATRVECAAMLTRFMKNIH